MMFGSKNTVSAKNNWLSGNSLFPARKRRTRALAKKMEFYTEKSEKLPQNTQKRRFLSKWLNFNRKTATITKSIAEKKPKPAVYSRRKSGNTSNINDYKDMSNRTVLPVWLFKLYQANNYSSVLTFILVVCTLTVYSLTVYSQQLWSQNYKRLQSLHRHERQLNTANATLTSKIAEDGEEPKPGVITANPETAIFINPTPENSPKPSLSPQTDTNLETESSTPLGY